VRETRFGGCCARVRLSRSSRIARKRPKFSFSSSDASRSVVSTLPSRPRPSPPFTSVPSLRARFAHPLCPDSRVTRVTRGVRRSRGSAIIKRSGCDKCARHIVPRKRVSLYRPLVSSLAPAITDFEIENNDAPVISRHTVRPIDSRKRSAIAPTLTSPSVPSVLLAAITPRRVARRTIGSDGRFPAALVDDDDKTRRYRR